MGVLLWAPESRFLGFMASQKYSRLSQFFHGFQHQDHRQLLARIDSQFQKLAKELADAGKLPFSEEPERIESLPDDVPLPEFSIEPDGCVSLDWMPAAYRTLTVSVGVSDRLPYAWVDGTDREHAVARLMDGQLPLRILAEIRRFMS